MDMIGDLSLLVADVSAAFGRYVKYHVTNYDEIHGKYIIHNT